MRLKNLMQAWEQKHNFSEQGPYNKKNKQKNSHQIRLHFSQLWLNDLRAVYTIEEIKFAH